jgi:tRNA G18 (ribose-2'-O)-methylase SpoU
VTAVSDCRDPRLADYVGLTDAKLRRSLEAEHGLFIAESERVIRRAVAAGYGLRSLLVTSDRLTALADLVEFCPGPVHVMSPAAAAELTGFQLHRGALASMQRLPLPSVAELVQRARRIIVLEDIVDHGNVGGIFRCAAALGVDAVIVSPRCADPLFRRSVRVSMGAVFAIPHARITDWYRGLAELREAGFRLLALTPGQEAVPIGQIELGERAALMLGTEGDGLSSRWLDAADQAVCIPMAPGALAVGVDSLNVVAAAAIACHEFARGGAAGPGLSAQ